MHQHPSAMEPMLPSGDSELGDMAVALVTESARTAGRLHPITEQTLRGLLRSINSYYSMLIADSARGPVRLGLPAHAVPYIFSGLFPEDLTSGTLY